MRDLLPNGVLSSLSDETHKLLCTTVAVHWKFQPVEQAEIVLLCDEICDIVIDSIV